MSSLIQLRHSISVFFLYLLKKRITSQYVEYNHWLYPSYVLFHILVMTQLTLVTSYIIGAL